MLICEAAAYYKEHGKSLWNQMLNMYEKYGYYKEGVKQVTLEGIGGAEKISKTMENLRRTPQMQIGQYKVEKIRDYSAQTILDCRTNEITKIDLPKSNVLYYELEGKNWVAIRPSGTEPKIKYYVGVKGNSMQDAETKMKEIMNVLDAKK